MEIKCLLDFDERTHTVTLRHYKTKVELLKIKLESCAINTMTRIDSNGMYDCSNYWIGIKPNDNTVFDKNLFGNTRLVIKDIDYIVEETKK